MFLFGVRLLPPVRRRALVPCLRPWLFICYSADPHHPTPPHPLSSLPGGVYQLVPEDLKDEAERQAKAELDSDDSDSDSDDN